MHQEQLAAVALKISRILIKPCSDELSLIDWENDYFCGDLGTGVDFNTRFGESCQSGTN